MNFAIILWNQKYNNIYNYIKNLSESKKYNEYNENETQIAHNYIKNLSGSEKNKMGNLLLNIHIEYQ